MAKQKAAVLAFAAAVFASSAALAEEPGPYINLGAGASFLEGLSVTGTQGRTVTLNENVGGLGISALGYQLQSGLRGEVEFGYRYNSAKNVTLPTGGTTPTSLNLKANAAALSYMANGLCDFQPVWGLIPHVGAGVGAATATAAGHARVHGLFRHEQRNAIAHGAPARPSGGDNSATSGNDSHNRDRPYRYGWSSTVQPRSLRPSSERRARRAHRARRAGGRDRHFRRRRVAACRANGPRDQRAAQPPRRHYGSGTGFLDRQPRTRASSSEARARWQWPFS